MRQVTERSCRRSANLPLTIEPAAASYSWRQKWRRKDRATVLYIFLYYYVWFGRSSPFLNSTERHLRLRSAVTLWFADEHARAPFSLFFYRPVSSGPLQSANRRRPRTYCHRRLHGPNISVGGLDANRIFKLYAIDQKLPEKD